MTGTTGTTGTGVTGTTGTTGTGVTGTTGTGGGGTGGDGTGTGVTGTGTGTGGGGTGTGTGGGGTGTGGGGGGTTTTPTKVTNPFSYGKSAAEDVQSIYNLVPGLTKANTNYELAGRFNMATGGAVATSQYDPFGLGSDVSDPANTPFVGTTLKMPKLTVGVTKRNVDYNLPGVKPKFNTGGGVEGHNPQFFSEGGLGSLKNRYVKGDGDGTSDDVPAMLANGEFVIPADVVSALGNGSNDAGAGILDQFLATIRKHKQKHKENKLPPDSKGPLAYLLEAQKKVKK